MLNRQLYGHKKEILDTVRSQMQMGARFLRMADEEYALSAALRKSDFTSPPVLPQGTFSSDPWSCVLLRVGLAFPRRGGDLR
jgi:hypothetical protein